MKKALFLVLILFLTSCDFESNVDDCRSELFTYDIATCKSAWRSTVCYAVDLDSDKILKYTKIHILIPLNMQLEHIRLRMIMFTIMSIGIITRMVKK